MALKDAKSPWRSDFSGFPRAFTGFDDHRLGKKRDSLSTVSLVREAGLEPARAYCTLEPESSESANSTTRAFCLRRSARDL